LGEDAEEDGEREERKQGSDAEGGAFPADDYVAVK
jgi:hypothetical protein